MTQEKKGEEKEALRATKDCRMEMKGSQMRIVA